MQIKHGLRKLEKERINKFGRKNWKTVSVVSLLHRLNTSLAKLCVVYFT